MKRIAVLGSTGSIGTQTLDVIRKNSDKLKVTSLVAFSNAKLLEQQVQEFAPSYYALICQDGEDCLIKAVQNCDVAVIATKGITAISAILFCLDNGIDVALANKEALVCAGSLIIPRIGKSRLIPVDSEHNAITQCLGKGKVSKILLTASGGPFCDYDKSKLHNVTAQQALQHPNWNMGNKITVDSATMMNKSLEVIEACWLFGVQAKDVQIVVHRQSIVHSLVEYSDGSVMAQLALPDMRLPIQQALSGNSDVGYGKLDFSQYTSLTFDKCDFDKFPCAKFGYDIWQYPPMCATVLNACNDVCVDAFIGGKLHFDEFYPTILQVLQHFAPILQGVPVSVENIKKVDFDVKQYTSKIVLGE